MMYLVRHGQAEFNLERRHQGRLDSPLTEQGREQARHAGETLATLIDPGDSVIFSSPLGRALQTARIIADVAAVESSIVVDPDLMEIGMGSAEGMTQAEMEQRWPAPRAVPTSETMSLQSPDGETIGHWPNDWPVPCAAFPIIMQHRVSSCPTALPGAYSVLFISA